MQPFNAQIPQRPVHAGTGMSNHPGFCCSNRWWRWWQWWQQEPVSCANQSNYCH